MDGQSTDNTTNAAVTTVTPRPTPVLDALKDKLANEDGQIATLTQKLADAVNTGNALQAKIDVLNATIDDLHDDLTEFQAIKAALGM